MSVKDVLQSLVDDNLVDTDKIGTSIYFWAYPSKAMHTVSTVSLSRHHPHCKSTSDHFTKHVMLLEIHQILKSVILLTCNLFSCNANVNWLPVSASPYGYSR